MKTTINKYNGNINEVIKVAWPIVISMLSYTAMGVTDTLFVGWIGKSELVAVGLATTAVFLVNSFLLGLLSGCKILSAQATGAKRHEEADSSGWHSVFIAVPAGFLVIALIFLDYYIFKIMGGSENVQSISRDYFGIRMLGSPVYYVTIALTHYYQGIGDTKTSMKINLLMNGLNIILDLVLIFGFGPIPAMGVKGAALATVISISISALFVSVLFIKKVGFIKKINFVLMKKLINIGMPNGIRYTLDIASWTVFTAILARKGESDLAAHQIVIKIISLSFLPGYGISEAACILTGQYVGANKHEAAGRAFINSMWLSVLIMGFFGILFWMIPEVLMKIFITDTEVINIGSKLLFVAAFFQVFDAIAMSAIGALNGTGDTKYTMYISLFCSWCILLPSTYFLGVVIGMGALGAWLGITFEIIVIGALSLHRFNSGVWKTKAVMVAQ